MIERKMTSLERMLKKEEQRLEARFSEFNKRREAALEKGDEQLLKRLETMEKRAVAEYEQRIERLLKSASRAPA